MLEKVRFSNWAAPIVPVVKPDGGVRICGDYKVTVNSTLEVDQHPLPNPEELFVALSGGENLRSWIYRAPISKYCWKKTRGSL